MLYLHIKLHSLFLQCLEVKTYAYLKIIWHINLAKQVSLAKKSYNMTTIIYTGPHRPTGIGGIGPATLF